MLLFVEFVKCSGQPHSHPISVLECAESARLGVCRPELRTNQGDSPPLGRMKAFTHTADYAFGERLAGTRDDLGGRAKQRGARLGSSGGNESGWNNRRGLCRSRVAMSTIK